MDTDHENDQNDKNILIRSFKLLAGFLLNVHELKVGEVFDS